MIEYVTVILDFYLVICMNRILFFGYYNPENTQLNFA